MFGFPSWIVLLVVAAVSAGSATYVTREVYQGDIAEIKLKHTTELSKQADEANALLIASKDAARDKERAMAAENSKLEAENAALLAQATGIRLANGRLIDATCGLFDRNGRPIKAGSSSGDGTSGGAAPAFSSQGRPASCDIPEKVLAAVRRFGHGVADLFHESDQNAILAGTGIGYAASVEKFLGTPQ